jgi:anti-sigma factor RsiW
MSRLSRLAPRDLDALSAYADGALSPAERQAMERRLEQDPALRQALKEIRTTSALLRALPEVRPPRNFTLTPETAGVRSGWLRTPLLQLATAVATLAFVLTVGVDVFGGSVQSAAFRAAAPAQEIAMEAPAVLGAADALEADAGATVAETAVVAAAPMGTPAATPTAAVQAEEYANREAPTAGGAGMVPPAPSQAPTAAPMLEAAPAVSGECEACGADLVLPTAAPQDKVAATAAAEEVAVTREPTVQVGELPAEAPVPETWARAGLPAVRWVEIGLGAVALFLGVVTLRARRRAR